MATSTEQFRAATNGTRADLDAALANGVITPDEWLTIAADMRDVANRTARLWAALSE